MMRIKKLDNILYLLKNFPMRSLIVALPLLVLGLVVTVLIAFRVQSDLVELTKQEFNFSSNQITQIVVDRFNAHTQILYSGAAFLAASENVTRQEWQTYAQNLSLESQFPGIQGLGYAVIIPATRLPEHLQKIRAEGFADYKVWPPGEREFYTSIIYLEPFSDRNLRAFGYDMFTEAVRRTAMERARDSNSAVLSGKVALVQENGQDVQAGTLLFVPVYQHGMQIETVAQRRAALLGWVYSPYRMKDLMGDIIGDWGGQAGKLIRLEIFDGDQLSLPNLLYTSQPASVADLPVGQAFTRVTPIYFAGRRWSLRFTQVSTPTSILDYGQIWLVLVGGTLISLLLYGLLLLMLTLRANALSLAVRMTTEFRASEAKFRAIINSAEDNVFTLDLEQRYTAVFGPLAEKMYRHQQYFLGRTAMEILGTQDPYGSVRFEANRRALAGEIARYEWVWGEGAKTSYYQTIVSPLRNESGAITGVMGLGRDITKFKQVEAALEIVNQELVFQNEEKAKRAVELEIANQELAFQNEEKAKRAAELEIANQELAFQNEEKVKRAAELEIANQELAFQNEETAKRAAELAHVNSYLENLINCANAPIIVWDPQYRITRFNQAFQFLTGRTQAQVLGQTMEFLFPPALAEISLEQIRKTSLGEPWNLVEIKIQHRDNSVRTVSWNSASLYGADGITRLAMIAHGQDITERRLVEQALDKTTLALAETAIQRESALKKLEIYQTDLLAQNDELHEQRNQLESLRERYFGLYDLAPVGYCTLNAEGLILEANLTAATLMGVPTKDLLNKQLHGFIAENCQGQYYFHRMNFIETGTLQTDELQMLKQDGTIFWAQVETSFSQGNKNERQARVLISDISGRKQLEQKLQEYASKLEVAMDIAKIAWWELDVVAGNVRFDKRKTEMLGYSFENFHYYKDFMAVVHPDDYDNAMNAMKDHLSGLREKYEVKYRILTKSGVYKWFYDIGSIAKKDENGIPLVVMGLVIDITEREQTLQLLEDTEERLSMLAEYGRVLTWEVDAAGVYTYISPTCLTMLGYTPEEIVGKKSFFDTHFEAGLAAIQSAVTELNHRPVSARNLENTLQTKDGQAIWVSTNLLPILDENGKLTGYRGVDTDISERKHAEDAMRETNALLSAFMKYSPMYSFIKAVTPTTSRVLKVSDNYQDLVGIAAAEMIGKSMEELFPLELAMQMTADDWSVICTGEVVELTEEINGRTYSSIKFPFRVGEKALLAGYRLDITDRKHTELALAQTAARLSLAVRAGGVGTWDYDLVNGSLTWDAQMFQLYGITPQDFSGAYASWQQGLHPQDRQRGSDEILAAQRGEKEFDTEFRVVWLNGSVHDIRAQAVVQRDEAGKPISMLGTNWDVTEQKLLFNQMQISVIEKDALLREVHHRVKNNLAAIIALIGLQESSLIDPVSKTAFNDLGNRVSAMALVHELLYSSENLVSIDLQTYLEKLTFQLSSLYQSSGQTQITVLAHDVFLNLDEAIPCGLIVSELITNSFKYAFPGGQPRPGEEICEIKVSATQNGSAYSLTVCDNGVGLPAGFDWKHSPTLGMSLIRMLGEHQLGARIYLDTTVGTCIEIEFDNKHRRNS